MISTYPAHLISEEREVHLLKLAHNFFPEIDIKCYSRGVSGVMLHHMITTRYAVLHCVTLHDHNTLCGVTLCYTT